MSPSGQEFAKFLAGLPRTEDKSAQTHKFWHKPTQDVKPGHPPDDKNKKAVAVSGIIWVQIGEVFLQRILGAPKFARTIQKHNLRGNHMKM